MVSSPSGSSIDAVFTPANADSKKLRFWSADETVATVDAEGVVTPKKSGSVKIYFESLDAYNLSTKPADHPVDSCVVYINSNASIEIKNAATATTPADLHVMAKKGILLDVAATPNEYAWTVKNSAGKEVDYVYVEKNTVKVNPAAFDVNYADSVFVVKATSTFDATKSDTTYVRVFANKVEELSLGASAIELTVGDKYEMNYTITDNADDKTVAWTVKGDAVTVADGVVTAAKGGEATVYLTANDKFNLGKKLVDSCKVKVNLLAPEAIAFAKDSITVNMLSKVQLAPVAYADAAKKTAADAKYNTAVTYTVAKYVSNGGAPSNLVQDKNVAGLFTAASYYTMIDWSLLDGYQPPFALKKGAERHVYDINTYVITATSVADPTVKASVKVTVLSNAPTKVTTTLQKVQIKEGETFTPTVTYAPANTLYPDTYYELSTTATSNLQIVNKTAVKATKASDETFTVTVTAPQTVTVNSQMYSLYPLYDYPTTTFLVEVVK